MSNYFLLTLDTLEPQGVDITISGGDARTKSQLVDIVVGTTDMVVGAVGGTEWVSDGVSVYTTTNLLSQIHVGDTAVLSDGVQPDTSFVVSAVSYEQRTTYAPFTTNVWGETSFADWVSAAVMPFNLSLIAYGYKMKIWGDVDTSNDPNIQSTENASAWQDLPSTSIPVKLSATDGVKTLYAKVMDDVGNESGERTDTILLDTTAPIVVIQTGPTPIKISKVTGFNIAAFSFNTGGVIGGYDPITPIPLTYTWDPSYPNALCVSGNVVTALVADGVSVNKVLHVIGLDSSENVVKTKDFMVSYAPYYIANGSTFGNPSSHPITIITYQTLVYPNELYSLDGSGEWAGTTHYDVSIIGENYVYPSGEDFVEYKVMVVDSESDPHDAVTNVAIPETDGSINMSGTGTFNSVDLIDCEITGTDLETASAGDGSKIIAVFVKDAIGNWSGSS